MTIRLNFLRETYKARLYEDKNHEEFWIPKSVVRSTLKWPNNVHELSIEEWWWDKHEFGDNPKDDDGLLDII